MDFLTQFIKTILFADHFMVMGSGEARIRSRYPFRQHPSFSLFAVKIHPNISWKSKQLWQSSDRRRPSYPIMKIPILKGAIRNSPVLKSGGVRSLLVAQKMHVVFSDPATDRICAGNIIHIVLFGCLKGHNIILHKLRNPSIGQTDPL